MVLNDEARRQLVETACQAQRWAYAPYSKYQVGAALLAASGKVYDGANVENAVYPLGLCAERVAAVKAVSQGERAFYALAVVTNNGVAPCGACRQVLSEFGADMLILIADTGGRILQETTLGALLPNVFGSQDLITG